MRHFEANLTAEAPLSTFSVNAQSSVRVLCLPPPLCSFHNSCNTADLIADVWERCPSRSLNSLKRSRNPTNVSPGRKFANCVLGICQEFFFFVVLVAPEGLWLVYATRSKATLASWLKCFTFFNVLYVILEEMITASQLHYCNCSQAEYKLLKVI